MPLFIVLLLLGFILLIKGADFFVEGSSSIAKTLKIPSIIIGLTIVAFGTSAPEAAVSIIAGINKQNDIALGNVIGSNIFNILAVLGISAIIKPMKIERSIIAKEYPFSILATVALLILSADKWLNSGANNLSRADAIVLVLFFIVFLYALITSALSSKDNVKTKEDEIKPKHSLLKSILLGAGGLTAIILGGQLVVDNATKIALQFGISEALVGLTIVAIGTSLPELVTSIVAAKKGESDIAIGNVVGSNIFNVFFVLSSSALINPLNISIINITDLIILTLVMVLVYFFCITQRKISRLEGIILSSLYIAYMIFIIKR